MFNDTSSDPLPGEIAIELCTPDGRKLESIREELLRDARTAMPQAVDTTDFQGPPERAHHLWQTLTCWLTIESPRQITPEELHDLEMSLYEFIHLNPTELALVNRLPANSSGLVVTGTDTGVLREHISSVVVLGLALRRFSMLVGRGYDVVVRRKPLSDL